MAPMAWSWLALHKLWCLHLHPLHTDEFPGSAQVWNWCFSILPQEHYTHFIFLSEAIFILLGDSITYKELEQAERLLQHFCLMFSALYSEGKETINVHSLLHLADGVRNLGPLWTHSCFPFESYNGNLLKLFHGTQNVELQIVSAVAITVFT